VATNVLHPKGLQTSLASSSSLIQGQMHTLSSTTLVEEPLALPISFLGGMLRAGEDGGTREALSQPRIWILRPVVEKEYSGGGGKEK